MDSKYFSPLAVSKTHLSKINHPSQLGLRMSLDYKISEISVRASRVIVCDLLCESRN